MLFKAVSKQHELRGTHTIPAARVQIMFTLKFHVGMDYGSLLKARGDSRN